jgi:hypothetical protein
MFKYIFSIIMIRHESGMHKLIVCILPKVEIILRERKAIDDRFYYFIEKETKILVIETDNIKMAIPESAPLIHSYMNMLKEFQGDPQTLEKFITGVDTCFTLYTENSHTCIY